MSAEFYGASGLAEKSGASMRQIDYWTTRGWLLPLDIQGRPSAGTGNHRIYGASEVAVARALLLAADRMTLAQAARAEYLGSQS